MKTQLTEQHNGRTYELESGNTITLELKPYWSKAKIEGAIADFEAQIADDKNYREWKSSIAATLEVLHGYTIEDLHQGFKLNLQLKRLWEKKLPAAEAVNTLLAELRQHNSLKQIKALEELGWEYIPKANRFTHLYFNEDGVRLACDCRTATGFIIEPDGRCQEVIYDNRRRTIWKVLENGKKSPETCSKDWKEFELLRVTVWVQLSDSLAVEVVGTFGDLLQVRVYPVADYGKNPTWYSIELTQRSEAVWDGNEQQEQMTFRLSRSSFNGDIELAARMHKGEALLLAIARDFDNFLIDPEDWLKNQPS